MLVSGFGFRVSGFGLRGYVADDLGQVEVTKRAVEDFGLGRVWLRPLEVSRHAQHLLRFGVEGPISNLPPGAAPVGFVFC